MTHLSFLHTGKTTMAEKVIPYILGKNLNFIVAQGACLNQRADTLSRETLDLYMDSFAACPLSLVPWPGDRPSPPFLAANTDKDTARLEFLIDLTCEASGGRASKFYSKILGALSTQVFAGAPGITRLFIPFKLEDTVGRGLALERDAGGTFIIRS